MELKCSECNRFVHSDKYSDKILIGDTFYIYTCSSCAASEAFERLPISWSNLIQLVLYHLWMGGDKKHRYFRWKEDICGTIEEKWDDLIPSKTKSASWSNSVSSALSSNDRIFASGVAIKGGPGWWALHNWEPPSPPRKLTLKRSHSTANTKIEVPLSIENDGIVEFEYEEDLIVDESDETADEATDELDIDNFKPADIEGIIETEDSEATVTTVANPVPSADLKQQLLERLLMMDSSLLQDAIKKAKTKKLAEIEVAAKRKRKEDAVAAAAATAALKEELIVKSTPLTSFSLPSECTSTLEPITASLAKRLQMYPVIRASPYENDLLKRCHRVNYLEQKSVARLRRKLLLRRQRRRVNLALFDLDQWMYLFLKSTEMALLTNSNNNNNNNNKQTNTLPVKFPLTFDSHSIPYIADPSKSLYVKLTGMAAIYGTCPFPVTSPFTGKILPEFIGEEPAEQCKNIGKLSVLNELRSYMSEDSDTQLTPSKLCLMSSLEPLTIKYTNLRKEFVGQLNDLLSESFWPGIDVSEALDYPDYAIIALVGLSVVGCAICNPEGYLSYLYVRPDFQGHHLAKKLLAILLPLLSARKDLTLHVSVSNAPAMLLYQRIGFKPEEFIVNFYDKYLGTGKEDFDTFIGSKNAFLMRLRR